MKLSRLAIWVSPLCLLVVLRTAIAADVSTVDLNAWQRFGRIDVKTSGDVVTIGNGFLADLRQRGDCEMSFRARSPESAGQVQIWAGIRVKDRDSRYVVGLRGGVEPQVSFARYAPDGQSKFLGFAPLDFVPKVGEWYRIRLAVLGKRFQVFVNETPLPQINIEDADAIWTDGGVALGGGWLATEFSDFTVTALQGERLAAFNAIGNRTQQRPSIDKATERVKQRAIYQPAKLAELPATRGELSLDGQWLFMPDQDLPTGTQAADASTADDSWHVMTVPAFWTPSLAWLHGEIGLPGLDRTPAANKGLSDELVIEEYDRVNAQTFDWKNTRAGWYRHHLELPGDLKGRRFEIDFNAIAKICEVWMNGRKVGDHVGMFGQVLCDITAAAKPGDNVIAVHVIGIPEEKVKDAGKVAAVAVTVDVTNEMLRSMPHGMVNSNPSGIWQPVRLIVTDPVHVSDVFIKPALDGAKAEVDVRNDSSEPRTFELRYRIAGASDHAVLDSGAVPNDVTIPANSSVVIPLQTPKLAPKLWSPAQPNLYEWEFTVSADGKTLDEYRERFGFRTFEVQGSQLMLNGQPYWLRGANHFPVTLRPNDAALAHKFIALAKEGNVCVTRSHGLPFTETWFDAADELGMGVSFEGTWTWLMLEGPPPDAALLKVWKDEFASLIRRFRNRPSLLFWTVNNEMKFTASTTEPPEMFKQKWTILTDMMKTMRKIDPTRPIVCDSSYSRARAKKVWPIIQQNHFDDGDIDDVHAYYAWYSGSIFQLFNGEFVKSFGTPGRPLISQEFSTGYPRNDDWPGRSYEFPRYVPQALVGNYAFEQNDPSIFMTRQAFITKEIGEAIRRTSRDGASGILQFAYATWLTNVWKADSIRPKVTYFALQKALQPVLASAELYGRHFYAGAKTSYRVCLMNDSEDCSTVSAGKLTWSVTSQNRTLAEGTIPTEELPYYSNRWMNLTSTMPAELPADRVDAQLKLRLEAGGRVVSENEYDIVLATRDWAKISDVGQVQRFDPAGALDATLKDLGIRAVKSSLDLDPQKLLIVDKASPEIKTFVEQGGRVLLLHPGNSLVKTFPDLVKNFRSTVGEIVTMHVPESPVFAGIEPLDTAWFEMGGRKMPYACGGTFEIDRSKAGVVTLADQCTPHGDVPKNSFFTIAGAPMVEINFGKGKLLASEMMLETRDADPVAGRLLRNMIEYLQAAR